MYSSSSILYAQNLAFEIVHQQSVKVYLHMYNKNVQQNPLYICGICAAFCVTKDLPISPRISPTFFYRDANSVLFRAHLCTAVRSFPLCAEPCDRNSSSAEREGLSLHIMCTTGMFSGILYGSLRSKLKKYLLCIIAQQHHVLQAWRRCSITFYAQSPLCISLTV